MTATTIQWIAAFLFAGALIHTFTASYFERLAHHSKHHSGLFHLLGEVEAVFGIWALFLVIAMAFAVDLNSAVEYVDTRKYVEPLFVFVIMVVAASRPVLDASRMLVEGLARLMPVNKGVAFTWLGLFMVPLLGSFITEPAAMTLAALLLRDVLFSKAVPNFIRYWGLGVLFVNISIGGVLTSFAAPPVLMVAGTWGCALVGHGYSPGPFGRGGAVCASPSCIHGYFSVFPGFHGGLQHLPVALVAEGRFAGSLLPGWLGGSWWHAAVVVAARCQWVGRWCVVHGCHGTHGDYRQCGAHLLGLAD